MIVTHVYVKYEVVTKARKDLRQLLKPTITILGNNSQGNNYNRIKCKATVSRSQKKLGQFHYHIFS